MHQRFAVLSFASLLLAACASHPTEDPAYSRYVRLGDDLASRGDPASAASLYDKATQVPGAGIDAWRKLGQARLATNDPRGAERAYQQALEQQPADADALLGLGTAQLKLGRYDRAVVALTQAADAGAGARAWDRLGVAQILRGQVGPAQAAFGKARALAPNDLDIQCNLALAQALGGQASSAFDGIRSVLQSPRVQARQQRNALLIAVLTGHEAQVPTLGLDEVPASQRPALIEQARQVKAMASPAAQAQALGLVQ